MGKQTRDSDLYAELKPYSIYELLFQLGDGIGNQFRMRTQNLREVVACFWALLLKLPASPCGLFTFTRTHTQTHRNSHTHTDRQTGRQAHARTTRKQFKLAPRTRVKSTKKSAARREQQQQSSRAHKAVGSSQEQWPPLLSETNRTRTRHELFWSRDSAASCFCN